MPMLRSLDQIDSVTLERWRRDPAAFIEECLVSPYDGQPYELIDAEREFIRHAFQLDSDGRLKFPLWVYSAIKKSRKTEFAALLMLTLILLYGGKYAEGFIVANDLGQAIDRVFSAVKRICQASPLLRNEFTATQDKIVFAATSTTIRALACSPDGIAGVHPTISTFDEAWTFSERAERMFHQLIPVPSRKISCRLVTSHAGFSEGLLFTLYQRAQRLPVVGKDLYAGNGLLCFWNHVPLHPWQTEKWLEEMRRELPADEFARMIENHFVTSSSNFITPEQWDACVTLPAPPQCHPHMPVMIGLDVATKRDSTAIVVVNGEKDNGVRVDDHKIFLPAPGQPIDLEQVEQVLLDSKKKYPNCTIVYDPREMELMAQRLKRLGIRTEEFPQTPSALSALTQNLYDLIRYQRLQVYPNERLRNSVISCVVEEKTTGQRLIRNRSQAKDTHIDVVIALGMAALRCVERHKSSVDWAHKYRAFDPSFRDEDLPPPDPNRQPSAAQSTLVDGYRAIAAAFGAPLHDRKAPIPKPLPPCNRSADGEWWKQR